MPKERKKNDVRIYLDTCILQGAMSRRNDEDVAFMKELRKKNWKVYTSTHSLMELYEIAKDRSFLFNLVYRRWVDVNTFLRLRTHKNLNKNDLDLIVKDFDNFFRTNDFIEFMDITADVWDDIKDIVEKSNIHSSDAMHLALARVLGCCILVTHDKFFIKEGNRLLKEGNQYNVLRICNVENVEKEIGEVKPKKTLLNIYG